MANSLVGKPRVLSVGSLEDPVPVLPMGRDDEAVALTTHGQLHRHAREGEPPPLERSRSPRRPSIRAWPADRPTGAVRRLVGHDLHGTGKVPAGPDQQVDLATSPPTRFLNDQVTQTPLGQKVREPGGHPIHSMRPSARMALEPPAENFTVGAIPIVAVEDEGGEGIPASDNTDVVTMKENRIDRLDHARS